MDRRQFMASGAAAATMLALGGRRASAQEVVRPDYYPADYAKMIEASKAETDLYVYSNMNLDIWERLTTPFNALYPWIRVQPFDLGSSEGVERYLAEKGSNSRTGDLIVTTAPEAWQNMVDRNEIEPYVSPESEKYPDWSKPSPGLYTVSVDPVMLLWNKVLLPDWNPKSFADLIEKVKADPEAFRGKLATMSPYLSEFGYAAFYAFLKYHGDKTWEWLDLIGPLTLGERSAGPMVEKITTGEYLAAYHLSAAPALRNFDDPARAELLGWSFFADGNPMLMRGAAVPIGATSKNSARLMLDYFLAREGQIALAAGGRVPARPDITSADVNGGYTYSSIAEEVGEDKLLVVGFDPEVIAQYDELTAKFRAAFEQ